MPREMDMNNLTEEDKAWLRSWNRGDEIPDSDGTAQVTTNLVPGNPPGNEIQPGQRPADDDTDPFNGEEPPEDYNDWNLDQLRFELGNRDLPKGGNKKDLVARLEEDDESNADEDEDEGEGNG